MWMQRIEFQETVSSPVSYVRVAMLKRLTSQPRYLSWPNRTLGHVRMSSMTGLTRAITSRSKTRRSLVS